DKSTPRWMKGWLIAAGLYNLLWGAVVVLVPNLLFNLAGMEPPRYPPVWQSVGMIVGVYGIGYLVAAGDPRRHWPIVLVGFLGKIFGPIGFVMAGIKGDLPWSFGMTILTNDLLWWIPFAMILWDSARNQGTPPDGESVPIDRALDGLRDQHGTTLREVTDRRATLVVLLRHSGCTFCKETLGDLRRQRRAIEEAGVGLAIVTMSSREANGGLADRYGLSDASWYSDPDRIAYRAFELTRGRFGQLFGVRVWVRGAMAVLRGHGVGKLDGDGFQLPGSFVVHEGRVVRAYRHAHAADRLDHVAFACAGPA
ncbi:MAG: SelL-related redox protein, partial [Planctomycetota bacterium]